MSQESGDVEALRAQHRSLDHEVRKMSASPLSCEIMIRDKKKKKLQLKEQIIALERDTSSDVQATA